MTTQYIFVAEITRAVDSAGTTVTSLACTGEGFVTRPTDTPANMPVPPTLMDPGSYRREMFAGNRAFGAVRPAFGNVELYNGDGRYDGWATDGFDGRDFVLRWGPLGGAYPADFETAFVATAEGVTLTESSAVLRLRDKLTLLEKPIVRATFAGTGGVEGGAELAGVAKQRFFGTAMYPPLQLIDASRRVYLLSTGRSIGSWAVWDNGIQLTNQGIPAATLDEFIDVYHQPDPGFFTIWGGPDEVYIRLGSNPAGDMRCSAVIGKPSGSAWALADWLAEAGYTGTIIGSLPNLGHVVEDSGTTWLDMLTHIAQHQGAWFGFDRLGRFVAKAFAAPAGAPVMTLSRQNCLSIKRMPTDGDGVPAMQLSINAGTAWKSSLAAGAQITRQEFSKEQWSARYTYSDAAVLAKHPAAGSIHMDIAPRMTSAQWVALRDKYRAWFFVDRSLIVATVPLTSESMALDLGDVVRVQWPRFGLSGGKDFVIVATRYDLRNRQIEYTLWG